MLPDPLKASIIIPARNAADTLPATIRSILMDPMHIGMEVIVVNDANEERISALASAFPVRLIGGDGRGAASARNIGVRSANADLFIFLDADCRVAANWLAAHLQSCPRNGAPMMIGGSVSPEKTASFWARCDHYSSWYNVHPDLPERWVPNHPPCNLSMSRITFDAVGPFEVELPFSGVHEEIAMQERLLNMGGRIRFNPAARVIHRDRSDFKSFLVHHYRWGYNTIETKSNKAVSRLQWVYRYPSLLMIGFVPFAIMHTIYILVSWLKGGRLEPVAYSPLIFFGRISYAYGMLSGGIKYRLRRRHNAL